MFGRMVEDQGKRGDFKVFEKEPGVKSCRSVRMAPPPEQVEWGPDMDVEETDDDIFMVA